MRRWLVLGLFLFCLIEWAVEQAKGLGKNRIVLDTSGQLGTGTDGVQWNVKVDLPVWERGL